MAANKTKKALVPTLRFKEFDVNWKTSKIGDVFDFKQGIQCAVEEQLLEQKNNYVRFIRIVDLTKKDEPIRFIKDPGKEHHVTKNDLFMVRYGNPGIIGINYEGVIANNLFRILPIISNLNTKFCYYIFLNMKNELDLISSSSTMPALNFTSLRTIILHLPTLPEQQKIAAFLSAVDEKIQLLTRKKELLEQYKKGVMQQLFSGKLRFKAGNGKAYPDWEEKSLDEIANFRRGSFPQPYGLSKWFDDINGYPFVQVYDVDDNMLLKKTTKTKISQLAADMSVFVKQGTLVLTIQGSIGRIAKTQYDSYVDRTLLIFQSYKTPVNVDYFKYVVSLLFEIEKNKAPGGTIKTITKEALRSFKILLPCIEEQNKIASFLAAIDTQLENVSKQITQTQTFKKGLLQQMFV